MKRTSFNTPSGTLSSASTMLTPFCRSSKFTMVSFDWTVIHESSSVLIFTCMPFIWIFTESRAVGLSVSKNFKGTVFSLLLQDNIKKQIPKTREKKRMDVFIEMLFDG